MHILQYRLFITNIFRVLLPIMMMSLNMYHWLIRTTLHCTSICIVLLKHKRFILSKIQITCNCEGHAHLWKYLQKNRTKIVQTSVAGQKMVSCDSCTIDSSERVQTGNSTQSMLPCLKLNLVHVPGSVY